MKYERLHLDDALLPSMRPQWLFDENALRPPTPDFLWCIHCERAYQYGESREHDGKATCPYLGCESSQAEPWDWMRVRRANPDYPGLPSHGVVYPLFGRGIYTRRA